MAATQQLARIGRDRFLLCRRDVDELARILSYDIELPEENVDLDWAPHQLEQAIAHLGNPRLSHLLSRLFGDADADVLSPDHPDGPPDDPAYSQVTYIDPQSVRELQALLRRLRPSDVVRACLQHKVKQEQPTDPRSYYHDMFTQLRAFIAKAHENRQYVVAWWD